MERRRKNERKRRRRTARERRAKEVKLGNRGGGLEGENKAQRWRTSGRPVLFFTAGRWQTGKKTTHVEINKPAFVRFPL